MRLFWILLLTLSMLTPGWAHEVVLKDESGRALVVLLLKPEWTAIASRDAVELTSPDDRTRIHCLELRSVENLEEARVFLQTMRESIFQTYESIANEPTQLNDGCPGILLRGRGMSRGFDTKLEALIFREPGGRLCLVMMQQDVGYEGNVADLKSIVSVP